MAVNSVVAREAWPQFRIAGPRRKLVALWNAVVNPTRKVRSSRTVKVGLSLWGRLRKQTAVRRVCFSQDRRLVCRASEVARWNDIFRLTTVEIASPSYGLRTTICFASSRLDNDERARDPRPFDVLRECRGSGTHHGMNRRRLHRPRAERSRATNFSSHAISGEALRIKGCMQCCLHGDVLRSAILWCLVSVFWVIDKPQ